jgi:SAM-dependent methyltransferase
LAQIFLDFTGERAVEGMTPGRVWEDHTARYRFACAYVRGKSVLDIACGTGFGSKILLQGGADRVVGMDISEDAIRFAREKYVAPRLEFEAGDILCIPSPRNSFERIVSFETLEHVHDPKRALEEMNRVLAPGGLLIISSPNRKLTSPQKTKEDAPANPFHVTEFTAPEFLEILNGRFEVLMTCGQRGAAKWKQIPPLRRLLLRLGPSLLSPERGNPEPEKRRWAKDYRYLIAVCRKAAASLEK